MTAAALDKRLAALEACRVADPVRLDAVGLAAAAHRYERSLSEPLDPQHEAYVGSRSLREIAADYEAMLGGAPAPWATRGVEP